MNSSAPSKARVIISVQTIDDAAFHRAVLQHGEGLFSVAKVSPDFKDQPATPEASFTFDELQKLALAVMAGDKKVAKTPGLGRIFAGGILTMMTALGIADVERKGERKNAEI